MGVRYKNFGGKAKLKNFKTGKFLAVPPIIEDGLSMHLDFEDVSGTTITDKTGNYTVNASSVDLVQGYKSDQTAFNFTGTNYLDIPAYAFPIVTSTFKGSFVFVSKGDICITTERKTSHVNHFYTNASTRFMVAESYSTASPYVHNSYSTTITRNTTVWSFNVIVLDRTTDYVDVYYNNNSETIYFPYLGTENYSNQNTSLEINRKHNYTWGTGFKTGVLNEFLYYNRALTSDEVSSLYLTLMS